MPGYPATSDATFRPDLQGLRMDFDLVADRKGFIGSKVFPVYEADEANGSFRIVKVESLLKASESGERNPESGYARDTWKFDEDNFATKEYGFEETIDDNLKARYRSLFSQEKVADMRAQDRLLRAYERRVAALAFDVTAFTNASMYADVSNWQSAGGTPVGDVDTGKRAIRSACGLWPNALIYNYHNHMYLRNNDQILNRISSSGAGSSTKANMVTVQQIAECFDLPDIFVAGGATNSANEGQAASIGEIWNSSYALLAVIARNPEDLEEPCLGRTIHWAGDGSVMEGRSEQYREEKVRGEIYRRRHQTAEKRMIIKCGYLMKID